MAEHVEDVCTSLGYKELIKPLQREVITHFINGRDVFASLPTG